MTSLIGDAAPAPTAPAGPARVDETTAAGRILQELRRGGPATRTMLATATGFSASTVNRAVAELLAYELLCDRPDLAPRGRVGRPHVPVDLNADRFVLAGAHVGVRDTLVVAGDLWGRELRRTTFPTPSRPDELFTRIGETIRAHERVLPERVPVRAGLAVGGRYDRSRGIVDHSRLGWAQLPVDALFGSVVATPYTVVPQVEAMAEVEYRRYEATFRHRPASWLYVYARETVAVAWLVDGVARSSVDGPGTVAHLPTEWRVQCECGRVGCLEAAVADSTVVDIAVRSGVLPAVDGIGSVYTAAESGNRVAAELLRHRSQVLGRAVALVRDIVNPEVVTVGGQAFTRYAPARAHVLDGYRRSSSYRDVPLRFSDHGDEIQSAAALGAASSAVFTDPTGALRMP